MYVYLQSYTYTLEHQRWCTAQDLGKLGMLETQIGKLLKGITPVLPEAELSRFDEAVSASERARGGG